VEYDPSRANQSPSLRPVYERRHVLPLELLSKEDQNLGLLMATFPATGRSLETYPQKKAKHSQAQLGGERKVSLKRD